MSYRILLITFCLLFVVSSLVLAENTIKIGVNQPMTGQMAAGGELGMKGINLAHELRPTVLGKKIELILVDNKSDKVDAAVAATKLIEKDKVIAILGSYGSSMSIPSGEVANKNGIPMLTATSTNPMVTQGKEYVFRACFIDPFQGEVMAKFTHEYLKLQKVALLIDIANDYSVGLAKFYKETFEKLGGEIVASLYYQAGDQDFSAQISQIISSGAQALFFPSYFQDAALIAIQARDLGFTGEFLGGDTLHNPVIVDLAKESSEGLFASTFFAPDAPTTEIAANFVAKFKEKYDELPNAVSTLTFDAYNLMLDSIEKAGSTEPEAIKNALAVTKNFVGAGGPIIINEEGDAIKPAVIVTIKDGEFKYYTTIQP
ncbi:MAG: ABC transporter substrate-binding protein [Halanaerobiales bacterium]|nr:ABC transporter substrate-binding protein [Halanaerobiales bacterium]